MDSPPVHGFAGLIAQVSTGEGKSMVIAMTSVIMTKGYDRKVNVLENNEGLLDRDFGKHKLFFETFGLTSKAVSNWGDMDADIDICKLNFIVLIL